MGGKNPIRHGTPACYTTRECRRPECRHAATVYQKQWRMRSMNGPTKVPAIGMARRVRALGVMGWPLRLLAQQVGMSAGGDMTAILNGRRQTITRAMHDRFVTLYDRLETTPGPSDIARRYAERAGWAPPMAWDPETIDDPDAEPNYGRKERGFDLDDWWFIVQGGEDPERAAERCGVTITAVERAAYRQGRLDVAAVTARVRNFQRGSVA